MIGALPVNEEFERFSTLRNEGASSLSTGAPPGRAATSAERDLSEAVQSALRATGYLALRNLSVIVKGDLANLRGHVPSYHQKQVAQSVAQRVPGIARVVNSVEVLSIP